MITAVNRLDVEKVIVALEKFNSDMSYNRDNDLRQAKEMAVNMTST